MMRKTPLMDAIVMKTVAEGMEEVESATEEESAKVAADIEAVRNEFKPIVERYVAERKDEYLLAAMSTEVIQLLKRRAPSKLDFAFQARLMFVVLNIEVEAVLHQWDKPEENKD